MLLPLNPPCQSKSDRSLMASGFCYTDWHRSQIRSVTVTATRDQPLPSQLQQRRTIKQRMIHQNRDWKPRDPSLLATCSRHHAVAMGWIAGNGARQALVMELVGGSHAAAVLVGT